VLVREFVKFGPIGSVKIIWPRTEEEHKRRSNCGFVSFMNRKDAEEAMAQMQGKELYGQAIRLNWSKPVPLPKQPLDVRSVLGVDAPSEGASKWSAPPQEEEEYAIPSTAVKYEVLWPARIEARIVIDRLATYVAQHGHVFEKLVMERERSNPKFTFLYNVNSSDHMFYRWRVWSLSQGDTLEKWRTTPFQMVVGGTLRTVLLIS